MLQASFSIIDQVMIGQLGETNISAVFLLASGLFPAQILGLYTKDVNIINTGAVAVTVSALLILLSGIYTGLYRVDYSVKESRWKI